MPRLFVAIDLPEQQRHNLAMLCTGMPAGTRWTPPHQLHLTLSFVGQVEAPRALEIQKTLDGLLFTPFRLQLKGLGCFPDQHHPRILWAGVTGKPELQLLQQMVTDRLRQLSPNQEEREFHPHVTIARLPSPLAKGILAAYLNRHGQTATAPFLVDRFHLYASQLTRAGAEHYLLRTYHAIVG